MATRVTAETLKTPHEGARATSEDVEMMEADYGMVMTMDQVINGVFGTPSNASNGHSKNVEDVAGSSMRKGKAPRNYYQR